MPPFEGKPTTMEASSSEVAAKMAAAMAKFNPKGYGAKPIPTQMHSSKESSKNSSDPATHKSSPEINKASSCSEQSPPHANPLKSFQAPGSQGDMEKRSSSTVPHESAHVEQSACGVQSRGKLTDDEIIAQDTDDEDDSPIKRKAPNGNRTWNNTWKNPQYRRDPPVPANPATRPIYAKTVRIPPDVLEEAQRLQAIHGGEVRDYVPDQSAQYGKPRAEVQWAKQQAAKARAKAAKTEQQRKAHEYKEKVLIAEQKRAALEAAADAAEAAALRRREGEQQRMLVKYREIAPTAEQKRSASEAAKAAEAAALRRQKAEQLLKAYEHRENVFTAERKRSAWEAANPAEAAALRRQEAAGAADARRIYAKAFALQSASSAPSKQNDPVVFDVSDASLSPVSRPLQIADMASISADSVVLDASDASMAPVSRALQIEGMASTSADSAQPNEELNHLGLPFSKPLGLQDVYDHHTKNGDYERQKKMYGATYAETLTKRIFGGLHPGQLSIPGATVKVVPKSKSNQFTTAPLDKPEQKTIAAPEPARQPVKGPTTVLRIVDHKTRKPVKVSTQKETVEVAKPIGQAASRFFQPLAQDTDPSAPKLASEFFNVSAQKTDASAEKTASTLSKVPVQKTDAPAKKTAGTLDKWLAKATKSVAAETPILQPKLELTAANLQYAEAVGRVDYPVPELGSERMPITRLHEFRKFEKLSTQVSNSLPPAIRDIPPPTYPFSKKPKLPEVDPAMNGAKPAPARTIAPLPNPFDPTTGLVVKIGRNGHGSGVGREESEFGDEDLPPAETKVYEESVPIVSRWKWFINPCLSVHGDDRENFEKRTLKQQLSQQYDHRVDADAWIYDAHGNLFYENENDEDPAQAIARMARIDTWMSQQFANTIAQPYSWDMNTPGFTSGKLPCSGLRYDYQEFPGDTAVDPITIHYGPIDWDAILEPKLTCPLFAKHFNRTAFAAVENTMAKIGSRTKNTEERARISRQIERERATIREQRERAIATADSSKALVYNNPHIIQGKIYIRPVKDSDDVKVMTHIYNYYIANTIDAPETKKLTVRDFEFMLTRLSTEGYPVLVAVLCVQPGDPPVHDKLTAGVRHNGTQYPVEMPVGFAYAKSWGGVGINAFTDVATAQVFVSPQYVARKVGTNLLDRLIGCIDRDYQTKQGAEIRVPVDGPQWDRNWKQPQTIVMRWFYQDINDPYVQGRKNFLESQFGMVETGKLVNSLSKNGNKTRYSMIQFQREANRFWKPEDDAVDSYWTPPKVKTDVKPKNSADDMSSIWDFCNDKTRRPGAKKPAKKDFDEDLDMLVFD